MLIRSVDRASTKGLFWFSMREKNMKEIKMDRREACAIIFSFFLSFSLGFLFLLRWRLVDLKFAFVNMHLC